MIEGEIKVGERFRHFDGSTSLVTGVAAGRVTYTQEGESDGSTFGVPGYTGDLTLGIFRGDHVARLASPAPAGLCAPSTAVLPPNPKTAHGAAKPALCLIPAVASLHEALAMEEGARKYGAFNWRTNAVEAMTYAHAAKRHLDAWIDGQECSGDTSPPVHNLEHARACLAILLDAQELGNLIDDRPPPGKAAEVQDRMKAAKIAAQAARELGVES